MQVIGNLFQRLIALCCYQCYGHMPLSILEILIVFPEGHQSDTTVFKMNLTREMKKNVGFNMYQNVNAS